MSNVKIIIADDHKLFAEGIKNLIESNSEHRISDIVYDGRELLEALKRTSPDLLLLDINMPKLNGLDALTKYGDQFRDLKVVILSTYNDHHIVEKARLSGAHAYLLKDTTKEDLLDCISKVLQGDIVFPQSKRVEPSSFDRNDSLLKRFHLTKREIEVLGLIGKHKTNTQIAESLFLSVYTVETHRKNIMQKLELNSPGALVKFIIEHSL